MNWYLKINGQWVPCTFEAAVQGLADGQAVKSEGRK